MHNVGAEGLGSLVRHRDQTAGQVQVQGGGRGLQSGADNGKRLREQATFPGAHWKAVIQAQGCKGPSPSYPRIGGARGTGRRAQGSRGLSKAFISQSRVHRLLSQPGSCMLVHVSGNSPERWLGT